VIIREAMDAFEESDTVLNRYLEIINVCEGSLKPKRRRSEHP
jgi:hypothetical protein